MKFIRLLIVKSILFIFLFPIQILLLECNSNKEKIAQDTVTIIIRHKVEDYKIWKRGYDSADWLRKEHGILFASVHKEESDPKDIVIVHQFKNLQVAKEFTKAFSDIMSKIGLIGKPVIWFTYDIEEIKYSQRDNMVTMFIRHKVEDYKKWKRGYDEADWLRKEHGIQFASVLKEESDPKDIIMVHQFKDMNGAKEFAKSIVDIMSKFGVIDKPVIWLSEDIEEIKYLR